MARIAGTGPTGPLARRAGGWVALALAAALLAGCSAIKRFGYEGIDREAWQRPDEVVALLGLATGDRVADLGAGGGYFTFRLADAVGPQGRVYAVDVDPAMLEHLRERAAELGRSNVEFVLAEPDDPKLPEGGIDLLFVSNTYHHLPDRVAYFRRVQGELAPNGRVAIVEFSEAKAGWFDRWIGHLTPKATIVDEMQQAGYRLLRDHSDLLDRQSFLIFGVD